MLNINGLNDKQLEAVRETEGYVRVIAGAGSGKTKLLVNRYAYLVTEFGIDPYNILCVTFTNKAANEMKSRIRKIIGNNFDTSLICTYHGFCARLLRDEYEKMFLSKNFQILDNYQQKAILDDIYQKYELKFDYASFENMLKKISLYKSNHPQYVSKMINPDNEKIINDDLSILDNKILEDYLKKEKMVHGLDFDDLIHFTIDLLVKNEEVRSKWQNRLNYILVDEFQDSSTNEMKLINILSDNYKNLMIVGDPDQNIYEWRGSDVKLLVDFDESHKDTKTIILDRNYRSTPEILKCANTLIDKNQLRMKKDLYTLNNSIDNVYHYHLKDEDRENEAISKIIRELKKEYNYDYSDFAILYRSNFLSRKIENGLVNNNIPYTIYGGVKFYQRMEILDALAYLKLICFNDDISFKRIINVPRRKMGKKKIDYLCSIQELENKPLYELLKEHIGDEIFSKSDASDFINMIDGLKKLSNNSKLSTIVEETIKQSGYDTYLRGLGDEERLDNIIEFKRTVLEFENTYGEIFNLNDYLKEVSLLAKDDDKEDLDAVKLMTIHSSKGLEFKVVILIGLNEGIFPSSKTLEERKDLGLEEERRLCYVALTRAMERLYLMDVEGISPAGMNNLPSRFIFEIGEDNYLRIGKISKSIMNQYLDYVSKHSFNTYKSNFKKGDVVDHRIFGKGKIVDVDDKRDSYVVEFDNLKLPRNISKKYFEPKEDKPDNINLNANDAIEPNNEINNSPINYLNDIEDLDDMVYYGENNFAEEEKSPLTKSNSLKDNNQFTESIHTFINKGNLWDNPNVPKKNWKCKKVYDLGSPIGTCEMCGNNIIRYVHVMSHKGYHDLHVGCICAGKMEGSVEEAKKRENRLKKRENRKDNFKNRKWKKSLAGNEYLKIKDHLVVIFYDPRNKKYKYSIEGKYSDNSYDNRNELIEALFEIFDEK